MKRKQIEEHRFANNMLYDQRLEGVALSIHVKVWDQTSRFLYKNTLIISLRNRLRRQ